MCFKHCCDCVLERVVQLCWYAITQVSQYDQLLLNVMGNKRKTVGLLRTGGKLVCVWGDATLRHCVLPRVLRGLHLPDIVELTINLFRFPDS